MKRINNLTVRLLLVILPVVVCVLALFAAQCKYLYRSMTEEEISKQWQLQVNHSAWQMTSLLSEINRMGLYISSNAELNERLTKATLRPEKFSRADCFSLFRDVIAPLFSLANSPNRFFYTLYPISDRVFCDYELVLPMERFPGSISSADVTGMGYPVAYYHMADMKIGGQRQSILCVSRAMFSSNGTALGIFNSNVYPALLEGTLNAILPKEDEYWYQCALRNGQVIFEKGVQTEDMLFFSSEAGDQITLRFGVRSSLIARQTERQNEALIQFAVVLVLSAAALIALLSSLVVARTRRVLKKFSKLRPGDPLIVEPLKGSDETARLDQTFTRLYRDYDESMRTQRKLLENQRLLETNLLLARINPHFLYNTLSALRWKLPREHWEIIDQLAVFYRGMLAKGRQIGLLSNEVELMRQYIALQRFAYSRSIDYTEDIAPDTASLLIPKFLLQPVLENAIKHSEGSETLRIRLESAKVEDKLVISVTNNGAPIDQKVMEQLNELNGQADDPLLRFDFSRNDSQGYGIFNIIVRLRILFGRGYGLFYERPGEGGTRARFILPICFQPEEIENWNKDRTL